MNDLTRQVGGKIGGEKEDDLGYLLRFSDTTERNLIGESLTLLVIELLGHGRLGPP